MVTGHDESGKSVFVSDETVDPDRRCCRRPSSFNCGAGDGTQFPDDGSMPDWHTYFPPVGGFRFGILTIPPETAADEQEFSTSRRRWPTSRASYPDF